MQARGRSRGLAGSHALALILLNKASVNCGRALSGLRPPMALDGVLELFGLVVARRLVRERSEEIVAIIAVQISYKFHF